MSRNELTEELQAKVVQCREEMLTSIRRRTGDPDLAEEVCQETLARVLARLERDGLADPDKLENFIFRVAANVLSEYRRSRARHLPDSEFVERAQSPIENQIESLSRSEASRLMWQSLNELSSEGYREVLVRFYLRQETKQHICEEMGLSAREFTQRIHRARKSLKTVLDRAEKRHGLRLVD